MPYQLNLTQNNVEFVKNDYPKQIHALNQFLPIINDCIQSGVPRESLSFGGGTALAMYYLGHRKSFDIDLFINDPQCFAYFSPKHWIDDNPHIAKDYGELSHQIYFYTNDNIKIDILVRPNIDKNLLDNSKTIFNSDIYIHSVEDIIANKIIHRRNDNKPRDIFDITASIDKYPNLLQSLIAKKAITANDIIELKSALQNVDMKKYTESIDLVEPAKKYENLALNAPKILVEKLNEISQTLEKNHAITKKSKISKSKKIDNEYTM